MRILVLFIIFSIGGVVYAQYVQQTLQQRIRNDNNMIQNGVACIQRCQADIQWANTDKQSILNDAQANTITNQINASQT